MPEPLTQANIEEIENDMHADFYTNNIVGMVCDEICPESEAEIFKIDGLPASIFKVLKAKTGENGEALVLPDELLRQYDISKYFSEDWGLQHLLLPPRGILYTGKDCDVNSVRCCDNVGLYICNFTGCLQS